MINDDRKSKLLAENRFYLELEHTHNGDLRCMLSDSECAIWDAFSSSHKELFSSERDWEWKVVSSIKRFEDTTKIARTGPCWGEIAKFNFSRFVRSEVRTTEIVSLECLLEFIFPLLEFQSDRLKSEIIYQLKLESRLTCDEFNEKYTEDWELYSVGLFEVVLHWLGTRDSEYLKLCAEVWRSALMRSSHAINEHSGGSVGFDSTDGLPIPWLLKEAERKRQLPGKVVEASYKLFRQRYGCNFKEYEDLFNLITPEDLPEFVVSRNSQKSKKAVEITLRGGKSWNYKKFLDVCGSILND